MDELDRRLAAADPAAAHPYRLPAGVVARVVGARRPTRVVRSFAWRVAGAATASVALSVAAVAALGQLTPAVVSLEVSAAVPPPRSAGSAAFASANANAIAVPGASGAAALHLGAPTRPAASIPLVRLSGPTSLRRAVVRLARALGVAGPATPLGGAPPSWRVGHPPGASVVVTGGPVPQWSYSSSSPGVAPATQSAGPVRNPTERARLRERAVHLLARLGLDLTLGRASDVAATMDGATASDVYREVTATFVVTHAGWATDQRVELSVDARGRLLYAAGPDVTATRDVFYALESPEAALRAISAVGTSHRGPRALAVRETLSLRAFVVRGRGTWWLPVYTFTTRSGARWQVLAHTSHELTIAPHASGLNARGVVEP
ncbi:MAG: hypothetical protein ACYCRG_00385 [Acidimicrobiales bacterium]